MNPPSHASRVAGLDAMRSLAICCVVFSHLFAPLEAIGVIGVELFFVLSGFLIGSGLYEGLSASHTFSMRDSWFFWRRRWARTLPNYYLFFLVHLIWWHVSGNSLSRSQISYLFFIQNLNHPTGGFYEVSWSLCVEEWFYFVLPLTTWVISKGGISPKRSFLLAAVIFAVLPPVWRALMPAPENWNLEVRMVVVTRLDAMMYGVAAAIWHHEMPAIWGRIRISLAYVSGTLSAILMVLLFRAFPNHPLPVPLWLYFSLLPLACSLSLPFWDAIARLPGMMGRTMETISRISYSIYLSHIPVIFACYAIMMPLLGSTVWKLAAKLIGVILTLIISYVVYRRFERPLMDRLSPRKLPVSAPDAMLSPAAL